MKEVNRKVGGLYTMFVKGATEGGTLKEQLRSTLTQSSTRVMDLFFTVPFAREILFMLGIYS